MVFSILDGQDVKIDTFNFGKQMPISWSSPPQYNQSKHNETGTIPQEDYTYKFRVRPQIN